MKERRPGDMLHTYCLSSWLQELMTNSVKIDLNILHRFYKCLFSLSFFYLHPFSRSSAYLARLSCPVTTVKAASSVSRAAVRTWAQRMNLQMMSTAQLRSARSAGAPFSARTAGAATVASTGRGTARWIAMAWCLSLALGLVDAFCLR